MTPTPHAVASQPWQEQLVQAGRQLGLEVPPALLPPLARYLDLLLEWNARLNLTAITDPGEVALKHFLDSLTVLLVVTMNPDTAALDVGAGAGFPGVPLALATGAAVDLLDSQAKRCRFLELVSTELGLRGQVLCRRAEEYARAEGRERYQVVMARAVAPLASLVEYCLPLVAVEGTLVAMKGSEGQAEAGGAAVAISTLGGELERILGFDLPFAAGARTLVVIRKARPTPSRYPRSAAAISKRPLG